ncbi:GNAT family N-acetyltransferase [Nocardia concava]|uniref:GNAT family N-acetyltransferase n=1 Tax=Nocardia concava TaxID=257281 RepID=UPI001FE0EFCF|nr:GNAT family N-acetyltransferase [Nocardia concava]
MAHNAADLRIAHPPGDNRNPPDLDSHVQEPHWHLLAIGTAPEVRGHGYGEALLLSGLARCQSDRLPAHLETSNPENIPYYERFGFELTATVDPPGGWPRNWLMRYNP